MVGTISDYGITAVSEFTLVVDLPIESSVDTLIFEDVVAEEQMGGNNEYSNEETQNGSREDSYEFLAKNKHFIILRKRAYEGSKPTTQARLGTPI